MGKTTKIDYADATWSPWIGCDQHDEQGQLREGCRHCYARAWANRTSFARGTWGKDAPRYFGSSSKGRQRHWRQPVNWNSNAEHEGVRRQVLVSLCDPLETGCEAKGVAQGMAAARAQFFQLVADTPWLDWLLLTKRPENLGLLEIHGIEEPLPNLWLGVSVWDQPSADRMIPLLLEVPAAVRWVSAEPLLGPLSLDYATWLGDPANAIGRGIDWLVVGCESRGARPGRPLEVTWAESLRDQCAEAGVPMYTKQLELPTWPGRLVKSRELAAYGWPVQMPARGRR